MWSLERFLESTTRYLDGPPALRETASRLLVWPPVDGVGRSTLNNDGTPLQVCISVDADTRALRVIADPAWTANPEERFAAARSALRDLLTVQGPGLRGPCERTLDATLPDDAAGRASLSTGCVWLASSLGGPGLALYTTARWGDEARRWPRVLRWLSRVLPEVGAARQLLEPIQGVARPVAQAIEGVGPQRARAKVYFRLREAAPLQRLGVPALLDARVADLVARLYSERPISVGGLVFSVGFSLADGAFADAKLDICAHCVPRDTGSWVALLRGWTRDQAIMDFGADAAVVEGGAEVAFVGVGVATDRMRTNLYLKPPAGLAPNADHDDGASG